MNRTPLRSMTGFGEAEAEAGMMRVRAEIRTVNQRHLKIQLRMPAGHERHQRRIERLLRTHFARGQVTATLTAEPTPDAPAERAVRFDADRAHAVAEGLRTLKAELGLDEPIDLALLSRFRGVVEVESADADPELPEDVLGEVVSEAALRAVAAREEEGAFLMEDLKARLDAMDAGISRVEARAAGAAHPRARPAPALGRGPDREARRDRGGPHRPGSRPPRRPVGRARGDRPLPLAPAGVPCHPRRRESERDREAARVCFPGAPPGGEHDRGPSANDAEIAESVVALKEEIEKVREQVENIE